MTVKNFDELVLHLLKKRLTATRCVGLAEDLSLFWREEGAFKLERRGGRLVRGAVTALRIADLPQQYQQARRRDDLPYHAVVVLSSLGKGFLPKTKLCRGLLGVSEIAEGWADAQRGSGEREGMGGTISTLVFQPPPATFLHNKKHFWLQTRNQHRIPVFHVERRCVRCAGADWFCCIPAKPEFASVAGVYCCR